MDLSIADFSVTDIPTFRSVAGNFGSRLFENQK